MKKGLIIILALIIILSSLAVADEVLLLSPADGISQTNNSMIFACNATSPLEIIVKANLRINFSADMPINKSLDASGNGIAATFLVPSIPDGAYAWNCEAVLNNGSKIFPASNRAFSISAAQANHAPNLTKNMPSIEWDKNGNRTINLSEYFSDEDDDILTYTASALQHIAITIAGDEATLVPEQGWSGSYAARFYASDGKLTAGSNEAMLTVTDPEAINWTAAQAPAKAIAITGASPAESPYAVEGAGATFSISVNGTDYTAAWYLDGTLVPSATSLSYAYQNAPGMHTLKVEVRGKSNQAAEHAWSVIGKAAAPSVPAVRPAVEQEPEPRCGDRNEDEGETCSSCPQDVKCLQGTECQNGRCAKPSGMGLALIIIIVLALIGGAVAAMLFARKKLSSPTEPQRFQPLAAVPETAQPKPAIAETPKIVISEMAEKPVSRPVQPQKPVVAAERPAAGVQRPKADPQLAAFIRKMRAKGHNDAEIKAKLKASGWTDGQIRPGFS